MEFNCKEFSLNHTSSSMKVGTDAILLSSLAPRNAKNVPRTSGRWRQNHQSLAGAEHVSWCTQLFTSSLLQFSGGKSVIFNELRIIADNCVFALLKLVGGEPLPHACKITEIVETDKVWGDKMMLRGWAIIKNYYGINIAITCVPSGCPISTDPLRN